MQHRLGRGAFIVTLLVALTALASIAGACSDESVSTTTVSSSAVGAGSTDGTAGTESQGDGTATMTDEHVVVGGKTAEEYAAMVPQLQKALEADPSSLPLLEELAVAQYNSGKFEEAAATYEKMLALEDTAFVRNNYANVLRDWGKTEDAVANYEKSISMDRTLVTPYLNLASLLSGLGKTQEAVATLESALGSVGPDDQKRVESYLEQLRGAK